MTDESRASDGPDLPDPQVNRSAAGDSSSFNLPAGLAGGIALIVAALAAVGVAGDLLTRAVRNQPAWMATLVALILAVVGVASIALLLADRRPKVIPIAVGAIVAAVIVAVVVAALGVADREVPSVELSAATADGITTISIEAAGSSLRTTDDMLVQLVGLEDLDEFDVMVPSCERSRLRDVDAGTFAGDVISWQRAGPDSSGEVSVSISVDVPAERYGAVCAFVALRDQDVYDPSDDRGVGAYLRLPEPTVTD